MVLKTNSLSKVYNGKTVVNTINLNIFEGDIFGLLGRNGAGKSTTIGLLTGFVIPTSGTFTILETPYEKLDTVKKYIGVLPDTSNYYNYLTAYEHIKFFASLKKFKMSNTEIIEILKLVGLNGHENKRVGKYSLGMKKKLGIAQAILGEPKIIFLDEPTSGLDPESAYEIQKLIRGLANQKKTIILTSHNLHEVETLCSRIAIMEEGNIACCGTMSELNNKYQTDIKLKIRTGRVSTVQKNTFIEAVKYFSNDINIDDNLFSININNEHDIPKIVKIATNEQIDIYRVEVEQLSLEKLFFNTVL
jgi:ABC-2 type transport system ATP-binding protein